MKIVALIGAIVYRSIIPARHAGETGSTPVSTAIWGMELLGVITSLAKRKTDGFESHILHHMPVFLSGQKERTCNASRKLHGFESPSRLHSSTAWGELEFIPLLGRIVTCYCYQEKIF